MTSGVNERPYLSIGEVLGLLLEEFPDVTISKIRFLESQGLIEPERTASGYRKFFDADVERLKVILREQRENFLPLRVIRDRLNGAVDDSGAIESPASASHTAPRGLRNVRVPADTEGATFSAPVVGGRDRATVPVSTASADADADAVIAPVAAASTASPEPPAAAPSSGDGVVTSRHPAAQSRAGLARPAVEPAAPAAAPTSSPASSLEPAPAPEELSPPTEAPAADAVAVAGAGPGRAPAATGEVYLRADVCGSCGITEQQLGELESYGLVAPRGNGAAATYTESDLAILRVAAGFLAHGIDARHLRGWRQSADREASLFEQRILPLLRQRNPQARHDAAGLLRELAQLGAQLREAILVASLRHHLDP